MKPWHRTAGKIGLGLMVAGALIGWKIHKKNNFAFELKAELIAMCSGHQDCTSAVNHHFETCFENSYDLGGRRRSAGFKQEKFLVCINENAGKGIFVLEAE